MAITTFSQNVADVFAAGTSLEARPASNWPAHKRPPAAGTTPVGSATATATSAASGVVSFTGLADSTEYYVSDAAGTRYVRITTYPQTSLLRSNDADLERLGTAQTRTQPLTITPASGVALTLNPVAASDGLKVQVPAYADSSHAGLHLTDTGTASSGPHLEIDQYGVGNALDLHWFPHSVVGTTGGCALGVHGYRDPGSGQALVIIDNTDAGNALKIKNTEGSNNPNSHGRGNFAELYGYTGATAHGTSDGTITSGQAVLTSASGTFTQKDVGKPIRVPGAGSAAGNLDTTILSYQSATQVTLAANASTSVTTANYIYPAVANVQQMAKITGNALGFGAASSNGAGNTGALRFVNTQSGTVNLSAAPWSFETSAGQCTALQVVQPSGSGGGLLINMSGTGFGFALQKSGTNTFVLTPAGANDGVNLAVGTSTGLKIGTGATQKIGFYNATPVAQQAGVAVTAAGVHAALVSLGLITA